MATPEKRTPTDYNTHHMQPGQRAARDPIGHPHTTPIFVGIDTSGSMHQIPQLMLDSLKELGNAIVAAGHVDHPLICIAGIGDTTAGDKTPFQVGQFQPNPDFLQDLANIFLEGGGGSNGKEGYDVVLYFLARMVRSHALIKRNQRGFAFIIGDEALPEMCFGDSISHVMNITTQTNVTIEQMMEEVLERWELFLIVPKTTQHYKSTMQESWRRFLGDRVIYLEEPEQIVNTITACISNTLTFL